MVALIRAEWLKLTKRPLTWILLAIFLGLLVLQLVANAAIVMALDAGMLGSGASSAAQLADYRRRVQFPGLFGAIFGHINGLGGVFAVILAAGAMGSEYNWGTLRTHLSRYPNRIGYVLAKLAALLLLLLCAMLLALLLGGGLGAALGALTGGAGIPDAAALLALPGALLRALYILLPYVLLALCFAVMGRSALVGIAGGLVYLVFEAGFGALAIFAQIGGPWKLLYGLTIGQNINTLALWNSHIFGLQPESISPALQADSLPAPLVATLVVALYSILLLATVLHFFYRRDLTGPA